jgi:hypothetical protein
MRVLQVGPCGTSLVLNWFKPWRAFRSLFLCAIIFDACFGGVGRACCAMPSFNAVANGEAKKNCSTIGLRPAGED